MVFEPWVKPRPRKKLACMAIDVKKRPVKYAVRVARLHGENLHRPVYGATSSGGRPGGGKSEICDFADQLEQPGDWPDFAPAGFARQRSVAAPRALERAAFSR